MEGGYVVSCIMYVYILPTCLEVLLQMYGVQGTLSVQYASCVIEFVF